MMVAGTPPCKLCEKIIMTVQSYRPFETLLELPNTYDVVGKKYEWKRDELMSYVLIPQSAEGTTGVVDIYLCIDEDILDDIDVRGFASKFLRESVLPEWPDIRDVHFSDALLSTPDVVGCWKVKERELPDLH